MVCSQISITRFEDGSRIGRPRSLFRHRPWGHPAACHEWSGGVSWKLRQETTARAGVSPVGKGPVICLQSPQSTGDFRPNRTLTANYARLSGLLLKKHGHWPTSQDESAVDECLRFITRCDSDSLQSSGLRTILQLPFAAFASYTTLPPTNVRTDSVFGKSSAGTVKIS
jgi:hypothetical protein